MLLSHKWHFIFYAQKVESGIFCNSPMLLIICRPAWLMGMVAYNLPLGKRTPRGLCLLCLLPHPVSLLHPVFVQLHDEGHSFSFRTPWHQGGRQWELTQVQAHAGGFQLVLVFPDCLSTFPSELSALHADFRIHHQTYDSLAGDNLASFYNCLRGNFYL